MQQMFERRSELSQEEFSKHRSSDAARYESLCRTLFQVNTSSSFVVMTTSDISLSLWTALIIHNHIAQLCPPSNEKTHGKHNWNSVTAFDHCLKWKEEKINTTAGTNLSLECPLSTTRGWGINHRNLAYCPQHLPHVMLPWIFNEFKHCKWSSHNAETVFRFTLPFRPLLKSTHTSSPRSFLLYQLEHF